MEVATLSERTTSNNRKSDHIYICAGESSLWIRMVVLLLCLFTRRTEKRVKWLIAICFRSLLNDLYDLVNMMLVTFIIELYNLNRKEHVAIHILSIVCPGLFFKKKSCEEMFRTFLSTRERVRLGAYLSSIEISSSYPNAGAASVFVSLCMVLLLSLHVNSDDAYLSRKV